jgi:uncharacterized membrane protein
VFSIVSLAAIVWLVMAYKDAPYVATWGILEWWKPIAMILMLPAVFLAVIGLTTPNPTSVGQEGRVARSPEGVVRVTRHPFLIGVGMWAVVHLIANGDVASFIFFGALAVTALAGTVSIDAKRRRTRRAGTGTAPRPTERGGHCAWAMPEQGSKAIGAGRRNCMPICDSRSREKSSRSRVWDRGRDV